MKRLPTDVLQQLEEMAARNKTVDDIQNRIKENGFLIAKPTIKKWMAELPLKKVKSVHDLPDEMKEEVATWWLTRRDFSSCMEDLSKAGYFSNISTLIRWFGELLRDETQSEISGDFDPSRAPISKELESWALTACLDKMIDMIMRSQTRPELRKPTDYARVADVLLKVVNTNISRRKLELEEDNLMARARVEFDRKIREMLSAHPELVQQIAAIADEADAELMVK